jgi:two-component system, OmpR family, response regulator RegX3
MTRVLVVEDEESYVAALSYVLEKEGFEVITASDGQQALQQFAETNPDLVLLDVMLPKLSGIDVCRQLRQTSDVPVIMVSARDDEIDKVVGLEIGADDYVTKPYSPRELLARMKAILRRSMLQETTSDQLVFGEIVMDLNRHRVTRKGDLVKLPKKEFQLLEQFLRQPGKTLSRELLIDRVWGADYVGDTKTLDVHVKRLRAKFEVEPGNPHLLHTVRGIGYRLESFND